MPIATVLLRFKVSKEDAEVRESCISVSGLEEDDKKNFMFDLDFDLEDDVIMKTEHFDYYLSSRGQRSLDYPSGTKNSRSEIQLESILFDKVTDSLNYLEKLGFEILSSTADSIVLTDLVQKTHLWTLKAPPKPKDKNSYSDEPPTLKRKKKSQ